MKLRPKILEFYNDKRGVALLELAIVIGLLISLLMGLVEFKEGWIFKKRIQDASYAVAQIAAKTETINNEQLSDLQFVAEQYLQPYITRSGAQPTVHITNVQFNDEDQPIVVWSRTLGTDGGNSEFYEANSILPSKISVTSDEANRSWIVVEMRYTYQPIVAYYIADTGIQMYNYDVQPSRGVGIELVE